MATSRIWLIGFATLVGACTSLAPSPTEPIVPAVLDASSLLPPTPPFPPPPAPIPEGELFGLATEAQLSPMSKEALAAARGTYQVKVAYPRAVNRRAVDSDVIVIEIEGQRYRFEGSVVHGAAPPMDTWTGSTASGNHAEIERTIESMAGSISIARRRFVFGAMDGSHAVFSELSFASPSAEEVERQRINAAQAQRWREKIASTPRVETREGKCVASGQSLRILEIAAREPQSAPAREWIASMLAGVAAQRVDLGC